MELNAFSGIPLSGLTLIISATAGTSSNLSVRLLTIMKVVSKTSRKDTSTMVLTEVNMKVKPVYGIVNGHLAPKQWLLLENSTTGNLNLKHWAIKNSFGTWELFLPDAADGTPAITHRTKVKARVETAYGEWVERIPAWIKWATQEWNEIQYNGVHYEPTEVGAPGEIHPDKAYTFKYPRPPRPANLRIYECHVGMSSQEPKVNSYLEFSKEMLPRIRKLGYNAIQIMAIQEHAYYGSFGYHVTNFFGVSSRCGTPDELKAMIDECHRLGMVVLMDIVHSHASKNTQDGINMFDGTDGMYFHGGGSWLSLDVGFPLLQLW
ncbi:hypothetical protein Ndes2437B_g05288 [Nannochloris sp. 'desiccata']